MHKNLTWMAAVVLLHAGTARVDAQEIAGTFDQLRVLVKAGDKVTVADNTGREITGRIADLSTSSLALIVGDQRHDLEAQDVNTIRQRRSDSIANGAKWGLAIGGGIGVLAGSRLAWAYEGDGRGAFVAMMALTYAGLGAGIGAGVDALISTNQVIYARPVARHPANSVTPVWTGSRRRYLVTIGF